MLNYKNYIKKLIFILLFLFGGAFIYVYHYTKQYPIPLTYRISLDEKFRFIRDMPNRKTVDTVIIGSSLGLNNIQGVVLENTSKIVHHVINISAYGLKTTEVETLLNLITIFPNLKRVIYSTQFPDFSDAFILENYDDKFIKDYIKLGKESINFKYAFYTYKNIIQFAKKHLNWKNEYTPNMMNFGLTFDRTGSNALHIYGDMINKEKFFNPHPLYQNEENYKALDRMAKKLHKKNINFYLIIDPYRQALIDKHKDLRQTMQKFVTRTNKIIKKDAGHFLNLHPILKLSDYYFVDRFHLNEHGSALMAKAIGKFIDTNE